MDDRKIPRITCEELKQLIDNGEDMVIIDIRSSSSYDAGHIGRAINIFYDPTGSPFERDIMLSALPADKLLVIYCD